MQVLGRLGCRCTKHRMRCGLAHCKCAAAFVKNNSLHGLWYLLTYR
jgi:hypothetical protein